MVVLNAGWPSDCRLEVAGEDMLNCSLCQRWSAHMSM
jgi:hypothetical protein